MAKYWLLVQCSSFCRPAWIRKRSRSTFHYSKVQYITRRKNSEIAILEGTWVLENGAQSVQCTANNAHTEDLVQCSDRTDPSRSRGKDTAAGGAHYQTLNINRNFSSFLMALAWLTLLKHASLMQCIGVSRKRIILFYLRSIYIFGSAVSLRYVFACWESWYCLRSIWESEKEKVLYCKQTEGYCLGPICSRDKLLNR